MVLLHFLFGTFHHTFDNDFRVRVKFPQLLLKTLRITACINLVVLVRVLFLNQIEGVRIGQQGCQFALEMVGLFGIDIDVVLDSDLVIRIKGTR